MFKRILKFFTFNLCIFLSNMQRYNQTKKRKTKKSNYRMMEEDEELIEVPEMRCVSEIFIQRLYNILRQGQNNNCFLEGAFVIADQDGRVLESLINTCFNNDGNPLNTMRPSWGGVITHDAFLNPESFRNVHRGSRLDLEFLAQKNITNIGQYYNSFNQYENDIRDINAGITELTFLCNPACRQNPNLEECIETRRKVKRVILFYPFMVVKNAANPVNEIRKRYVYLKLEDSHAVSLQHVVSASQAYTNPVSSDSSGFDYRRERLKRSDEDRYKAVLRSKDQSFYYDLFSIGRNNEGVRFYNDYVRSNDEFFVPQEMTDRIFEEL